MKKLWPGKDGDFLRETWFFLSKCVSREVRPTFLMQLLMLSPELVYPTSWATLGGPVFCFSEYFLVKELKKEKKKNAHFSCFQGSEFWICRARSCGVPRGWVSWAYERNSFFTEYFSIVTVKELKSAPFFCLHGSEFWICRAQSLPLPRGWVWWPYELKFFFNEYFSIVTVFLRWGGSSYFSPPEFGRGFPVELLVVKSWKNSREYPLACSLSMSKGVCVTWTADFQRIFRWGGRRPPPAVNPSFRDVFPLSFKFVAKYQVDGVFVV